MQQPKKPFEQVLEDNKEKIYRICRVYAVTPVEPQDLFQEVVYQAWKSFPAFKGESGEGTWLYKIALNVCMRAKLKLEKTDNKNVRLESIRFMPVKSAHDELQEERYQFLRECITRLNEGDQSLVILYLEELAYKEIALVTGLSENHVAVKMKRIRKMLFDCITPKLG